LRKFPWATILLVMTGIAVGGSLSRTVTCDPADAILGISGRWSTVSMNGFQLEGEPGAPLLPSSPEVFILPSGAMNVEFSVIPVERSRIGSGNLNIIPARDLRPLNMSGTPSVPVPDPAVYSLTEPWPASPMIWHHTGNLSGFTVASCLLQPWEYVPATGELSLVTELLVTVTWEDGASAVLSGPQLEAARIRVAALAGSDPEDMVYQPVSALWGDAEYLIVCDSGFTDVLQPFADLQQNRGRTVEMATIQYVLSSFAGTDDADRLRNFIRDRFQNHGTVYVLLAGDETLIPVRLIETECEGYHDFAPVDLYFADLDGTWDGNGDGNYGQPDDSLDLYADVILARALFADTVDASVFVQKNLSYQTNQTPESWPSRAVLCGAVLFRDIGYTAAKGADSIAAAIPLDWDITKAYEMLDGDGIDTHIAIISSGTGWNYYGGHGTEMGTFWSRAPMGMMTNWIVTDSLENGSRTGIHTSIGCHPGAYIGVECNAEALLHKPDGGGVAVMFNTSYGWEGHWPSLGPSEWMCIDLARQVFREQSPSLGLAFTIAKDLRVPQMHGGYSRTLQSLLSWSAFMDPALAVRSAQGDHPQPPVPLTISHPYPNPATRDAPVSFYVDFPTSSATVTVHDMAGRLLWKEVIDSPGRVSWEGENPSGQRVPAGVYIITASCPGGFTSRLATILY